MPPKPVMTDAEILEAIARYENPPAVSVPIFSGSVTISFD